VRHFPRVKLLEEHRKAEIHVKLRFWFVFCSVPVILVFVASSDVGCAGLYARCPNCRILLGKRQTCQSMAHETHLDLLHACLTTLHAAHGLAQFYVLHAYNLGQANT
jgi:hypothetical protein